MSLPVDESFWVAERSYQGQPLYACEPFDDNGRTCIASSDIHRARGFLTRAACEAWIVTEDLGSYFMAREHMICSPPRTTS